MNIYFVCDEENSGVYVFEETRGKAKTWYPDYPETDFIYIHCRLIQKDVGETKAGELTNKDLKKYDLHYYDEDGNEIDWEDL